MKNLLKSLLVASTLVLASFAPDTSYPSADSTWELKCKYRQCQATAKSTDKQCRHCVSNEDDYYCWQHK